MFKDLTTVSQGSIGLGAAIFYYQKLGYRILLPLVDNQPYDIVLEKDSIFNTVQVKTTRFKQNNNYVVQLKKVRHNRTENKISKIEKVDFIFVLCDNGDCYSVPFDKLTSLYELRLSKFKDYKITY